MLHTLPNEVLKVITEQLSFSDKLNLCKTCHKLHEKISRTNLYGTLKLRKNTENIIRMFQDKIFDGAQVQVLDIIMDHLSDELYSNLADIFPNVTRIKTSGKSPYYYEHHQQHEEKEREDYIIRPLLSWKDSLKKYNSFEDWIFFRAELFSSNFPRLEDLISGEAVTIPGRKEGFDPLFLAKGIANAPMLISLTLRKCDISIDSLEVIHAGCPYIRSLEFDDVMLIVDNNTLPTSIVPANLMLRLELRATSFDKHGLFLDYIIKKYPNLQDLDLWFVYSNIDSIESELTDYYPSFKILIPGDPEEHSQVCRKRINELIPTTELYKDGSSAFLSGLPKSIRKLSVQFDIFDKAIEILSKSNPTLSSLYLFELEDLNISIGFDQIEYIKNINALKSMGIYMKSSLQAYNINIISDTITSLDITLIDAGFHLDWILYMFPSLELLSIDSEYYLDMEKKDKNTIYGGKVYSKLRKLGLERCKVDPESLDYIKRVLPNVEGLKWTVFYNSLYKHKINYSVDLTGWNLLKLDMLTETVNSINIKNYTVISTPKITHRFLHRKFDKASFPVQGEPEFVEGAARINIICNHINDFTLNYRTIHL